jgi:hypothetical protein
MRTLASRLAWRRRQSRAKAVSAASDTHCSFAVVRVTTRHPQPPLSAPLAGGSASDEHAASAAGAPASQDPKITQALDHAAAQTPLCVQHAAGPRTSPQSSLHAGWAAGIRTAPIELIRHRVGEGRGLILTTGTVG